MLYFIVWRTKLNQFIALKQCLLCGGSVSYPRLLNLCQNSLAKWKLYEQLVI